MKTDKKNLFNSKLHVLYIVSNYYTSRSVIDSRSKQRLICFRSDAPDEDELVVVVVDETDVLVVFVIFLAIAWPDNYRWHLQSKFLPVADTLPAPRLRPKMTDREITAAMTSAEAMRPTARILTDFIIRVCFFCSSCTGTRESKMEWKAEQSVSKLTKRET